ncbi:heterokaryon incompatibility protein-domain-containing protein [Dactylonectria estremocensis]|uniref:Heterokaryon incompatibility protein-domain-containing protein n=1 Tax=Dactylonectria estremocensis TaxID=1079267 RepID=A0A9P9IR79_9HYPO|nr:heterokaryon incompatibility protein-domain-containing protein [Dactylonectria estremocensis]
MSAYASSIGSNSIRLANIDLVPGGDSGESQIPRITLTTHQLADATAPEYYALSYTWGRPRKNVPDNPKSEACPVLLNGQASHVQPNLYDALFHLHQFCPQKPMWIDALCINQDNVAERQLQVAIMDRIFGGASLVTIWLGKPFPQLELGLKVIDRVSEVAFREVARILKTQQYEIAVDADDIEEKYGLAPFTMDEAEAIMDVFESRWFGRVWVIQEVALAKEVGVLRGDSIMPFDKIGAVAVFLHITGLSLAIGYKLARIDRDVDFINENFLYRAERTQILREWCLGDRSKWFELMPLVDFTAGIEHESGKEGTIGLILLKILLWTIGFNASNQRDAVYGLWGILQHMATTQGLDIPDRLRPNYETSVTELFQTVATEILETSGTLMLLTLVKDPQQRVVTELPSWCPDFSSTVGSHPISGPQLKSVAPVNAGGYMEKAPRGPSLGGAALNLRGFCLGSVELTGETWPELVEGELAKWIKILMRMDQVYAPTGQSADEAFWRTLIHDQDFGNRPSRLVTGQDFQNTLSTRASSRLRQDFKVGGTEAVAERLESWRDIDTLAERYPDSIEGLDVLRRYCSGKGFLSTADGQDPVTEKESDAWRSDVYDGASMFAALLGGTMFNRCIVHTAEEYLAHASGSTCAGDEIWILAGCPSPLVLRAAEERGEYRLIGEAYVHGVMNGEAITDGAEWRNISLA